MYRVRNSVCTIPLSCVDNDDASCVGAGCKTLFIQSVIC